MSAQKSDANLEIALKVTPRKEGKAKHLRHQELVPLVLYGKKIKNHNLMASRKELESILKEYGTTTLIDLIIDKQKPVKILIRDPQLHPVSHQILHADLYQVDLTRKIITSIPIVFTGKSIAVEELDGTLIETKTEVEVECLPQDLPHELKVDISKLATFEDVLRVEDIKIPEKVTILDNTTEVLASVSEPRSEEELAALDEAVEEDVEGVAVEGEKEEGEGEKEEGEEKAEEQAESAETKETPEKILDQKQAGDSNQKNS